jgi:hypothetical protein
VFLLLFGLFGGVARAAGWSRWRGLGVLLAPAVMVYAHRTAAAVAAVFAAVLWTPLAGPLPAVAVAWLYAGLVVRIARRDRPLPAEPLPHRLVPRPATVPRPAVPAEVFGYALAALAAAGLLGAAAGSPAWLALAVPAAGLGAALLLHAARCRRAVRSLFTVPQPARAARAVEQEGYVHVLVPLPDGLTALELGFDVAEHAPDGADDDEPHTIEAVLYGEPRAGAWCAVEAGGRVHVPVGPVEDVVRIAYDVVDHLPREIEDDEEQLVDPEALRPADRDAGAFEPREHRIAPQRAWAATTAICLGTALAAAELGRLAGLARPAVAALVVLAAAAGGEYGWRSQLRPRLRWHAGGVASVGFGGPDRQPWATDSAVVHDDEGTVVLTAGASVLTVPVPPPWPARAAQRTADQLVAALREARTRSFEISPLPPPPDLDPPGRPLALYPLAAACVALALTIAG